MIPSSLTNEVCKEMVNLAEHQHVIDEPLSQYKNFYKEAHHTNVKSFIDELIEKNNINKDQNRETVKKIRSQESHKAKLKKTYGNFKLLKTVLIILVIIALIAMINGILNIVNFGFLLPYVAVSAGSLIGTSLMIFLLVKKINPKIKELKNQKNKSKALIESLYEEAWGQLKALNDSLYDGMSSELFNKTLPLVEVDEMFDSKRLDYMVSKFGLPKRQDKNRSALFVQSGVIKGNPFYICDELVHKLSKKTYTGSKTIHWTTTSRVNGKTVTRTHSQTLTASVTKPFPVYYEEPYLVYANDAAPDLSFTRKKAGTHKLSEKQIDSKVNKETKKLSKASAKSITKGGSYTLMGNHEFEVLFGANDRDHEVQFRMLFTPLAQTQLLRLMKDKEVGYGDDFDFMKKKKINYIRPKHLEDVKLDVSPSYFKSYDIDALYENFITYNNEFFKHLYFTLAPILAIPIYQQTVTHEYIYKDLYDSYVSFYEHEKVVNRMGLDAFKHPKSNTKNILKTRVIKSEDHCDTVEVTAYGYTAEKRVDYITRRGNDGRIHQVPVHWVEYIPVTERKQVEIAVAEATKELTHQERIRQMFERLQSKDVTQRDVFRMSTFMARLINGNEDKKI